MNLFGLEQELHGQDQVPEAARQGSPPGESRFGPRRPVARKMAVDDGRPVEAIFATGAHQGVVRSMAVDDNAPIEIEALSPDGNGVASAFSMASERPSLDNLEAEAQSIEVEAFDADLEATVRSAAISPDVAASGAAAPVNWAALEQGLSLEQAPAEERDTFAEDLQAILSGAKTYDTDRGLSDPAPVKETSPPPVSPPTHPHDVFERLGRSMSTADPPERGSVASSHDVFDRIGQAMSYTNTFDLGDISLEKRFDEFDAALDDEEAAAQQPKRPAPTSGALALNEMDLFEDLALMQARMPEGKPVRQGDVLDYDLIRARQTADEAGATLAVAQERPEPSYHSAAMGNGDKEVKTKRCVEPALAQEGKGQYLVEAAPDEELLFPHVDSCLAIAFILADGRRIGGHVAWQMGGDQHEPLDPYGNALRICERMFDLTKKGRIVKVIMVGDGNWKREFIAERDVIQAIINRVGCRDTLFVNTANYGGGVDVSLNPRRNMVFVQHCVEPYSLVFQRAYDDIRGAQEEVPEPPPSLSQAKSLGRFSRQFSVPEFELFAHKEVKIVDLTETLAVPVALGRLLEKSSTQEAAEYLEGLLDEVNKDALDKETTIVKANPDRTEDVKREYRISNWSSGGGHTVFSGKGDKGWRFKADGNAIFFKGVFDAVKEAIPGAQYTRNNFFHGHAVYDKVGDKPDFRIVFHAYEYPANFEQTKSDQAKILEPKVAPFDAMSKDYYQRNAIWSMRDNKIYVPNYYRYLVTMDGEDEEGFKPYMNLLTAKEETCTVDQEKVGEQVMTFCYFPTEGVGIFGMY